MFWWRLQKGAEGSIKLVQRSVASKTCSKEEFIRTFYRSCCSLSVPQSLWSSPHQGFNGRSHATTLAHPWLGACNAHPYTTESSDTSASEEENSLNDSNTEGLEGQEPSDPDSHGNTRFSSGIGSTLAAAKPFQSRRYKLSLAPEARVPPVSLSEDLVEAAEDTIAESGQAASEILEAAANVNEAQTPDTRQATESRKIPDDEGVGSLQAEEETAGSLDEGDLFIDDWEAIVSDKWVIDELEDIDIGSYLGLPRQYLPEVFFENLLPGEELHRRGGCQGLEEELAASDTDLVMYRQCMHALATDVFHKARKQIYLVGPASSGKSIAMATLVTQMRSLEWLVMYIPEAKQLTAGGFFNRHPDLPVWDTPEIAKLMLHYLVEGNPNRADTEKSQKSGRSLRELAQAAASTTDPHLIVDLFLEAKDTVAAASNALIAIDNYQALYVPTEYGEWLSPKKRRVITTDELRVASAMKLLEQEPLKDGVVLCAAQRAASFSQRSRLPLTHESACFTVPRMNFEEWAAMSDFSKMTNAIAPLSDYAIRKAYFTMGGNPKELRRYAPLISVDDGNGPADEDSLEEQPVAAAPSRR